MQSLETRARDRDQNPSRPRLQEAGLETRLQTATKSRDSITASNTKHVISSSSCDMPSVCRAVAKVPQTPIRMANEKLGDLLLFVHLQKPQQTYFRGLASVAYAENFHEGGFHSVADGGHLYLVCVVWDVTIWRHIHVFKRHLLTEVICFYTHSPYFCKKSSPIHSPYNKVFCKISSSRGEFQPQHQPLAYALASHQ